MSDELDVVIIGGGVIGLAIARALALAGRSVHLLEAESQLGMHASSRNSEVIHAGIYYPPGSLKARLCVRGRAALYAFCERAQVAHRRVGKLIVAVNESERALLESYRVRALANGVGDVRMLEAGEVMALEPAVRCVAALHSPSTGILDSHGLLLALQREAQVHGATLLTRSPVRGGRVLDRGFELTLDDFSVHTRVLVNCAGLAAARVARSLTGLDAHSIPAPHYARGHYFVLQRASPFRHLVYPLPGAHGLGIHVTLDLQGRARFGPDVEFVDEVSYTFDARRRSAFAAAIRRYYPELSDDDLAEGYVGVRPKLGPEGSAASDFVIQDARVHGVRGLVNLYGIESPGLTASLAIAEEVASIVALDR